MTGAPAETWHKFRFVTVPGWAYAFLILLCTGIGLLPIFIILAVVSRRAAGHLPLTRSSRTRIRLATWVPFALIPIAFAMWIAAAIIGSAAGSGSSPGATGDSIGSGIATALLLLGILTVLVGLLGLVLLRPLVAPVGKVLPAQTGQVDNLVEIRRLHPAFVIAVQHHQQMRAAQYMPAPPPPILPGSK